MSAPTSSQVRYIAIEDVLANVSFLVPSDDTVTMGDLVKHTAVMILWPKPLPGTNITSSPYMDELKNKSNKLKLQAAELNEARSKLKMQELLELEGKPSHQTKQQGGGRKPTGDYAENLLYHV